MAHSAKNNKKHPHKAPDKAPSGCFIRSGRFMRVLYPGAFGGCFLGVLYGGALKRTLQKHPRKAPGQSIPQKHPDKAPLLAALLAALLHCGWCRPTQPSSGSACHPAAPGSLPPPVPCATSPAQNPNCTWLDIPPLYLHPHPSLLAPLLPCIMLPMLTPTIHDTRMQP